MIASIRGNVLTKGAGALVLNVGDIGYRVFVPTSLLQRTSVGETLFLHTHLVVREDSRALYGFADELSLEVFETLLGVTGVGPKSALAVISATSVDDIVAAVRTERAQVFQSVSGIGPKTAKLILVSLAGKFDHLVAAGQQLAPEDGGAQQSTVHSQVVQGLIGLGWSEREALQAVRDAAGAGAQDDAQALLRAALKLLQQPGAGGGGGR